MTSRTPAELFHPYMPDRESYLGAAAMLDYNPPRERSFEYVADDFEDLARQLGV